MKLSDLAIFPDKPWLESSTIFLARHGSHAYGTNTPTSDRDYRGVALTPRSYLLGFLQRFEQAECREPDLVIFELRKFMALAAECNPNTVELLFSDSSDILLCNKLGQMLLDHRNLFLSRKARHTFSGYAMSQLKRIKGHYKWLRDPPKAPPVRSEFNLPERTVIPADQMAAAMASVQKKLDGWEWKELEDVDPATRIAILNNTAEIIAEMGLFSDEQAKMRSAARSIGFEENFLLLLDRERQYHARHREWELYQTWKNTRNPDRAALEAKFGFDTKHAMHLVRLMRMCREILETGEVWVKRPDRDELLAIRNGAWTYEQLLEWAVDQDRELERLYQTSELPRVPDRARLDQLSIELYETWLSDPASRDRHV